METQPMMQSTVSTANNTVEEISGGCVMHRYKGHKAKRVCQVMCQFFCTSCFDC